MELESPEPVEFDICPSTYVGIELDYKTTPYWCRRLLGGMGEFPYMLQSESESLA